MARWSAAVVWDNFRAQYDDIEPPEVTRSVDLFNTGFTPRTVEVQLRIPGALAMRRAGHPVEACSVALYRDGVAWCTSPVLQIRTNGASPLVTVVMADRPARENPIPPTTEISIRSLDVERTKLAADTAEQLRQTELANWIRYDKAHPFRPDPVPWNLTGGWIVPGKIYSTRVQGKVLPVVIGRPGRNGEPAWRCLPLDEDERLLLVAGHHMAPGTVTIHKDIGTDNMHPTSYDIINTQVDGRNVAVVELPTTPVQLSYDEGSTWYASCDGTASGLPGDAPSVVRLLFGLTRGVRFDRASWSQADAVLRSYYLDTAMDQVADAWEVLVNDVLQLLPVRLIDTAWGLGAVAVPREPSEVLDKKLVKLGQTADRISEDEVMGRPDRVSEVTVAFAGSAASGGFTRSVIANAANSVRAREAFGAIGTAALRIETPWIGEDATAQRVAQDAVALGSMDGVELSLMLVPEHHGEDGVVPLELCDVVQLIEDEDGVEVRRDGVVVALSQLGADIRATILVVH